MITKAEIARITQEANYHPCKGSLSKLVVELNVSDQMWLPFEQGRQSNVHTFARRFGMRIKTETIYKGGVKGIRIKRVA